jgi:hypothetical protein
MENEQKSIGLSFFKTLEYLLDFYTPLLLIYGIFLFDSLEIIVYGKGILDTDFSGLLNLSAIPFFLLFLVTFGVVSTSLSALMNGAMLKLYSCTSSKIELFINWLLGFESISKKAENLINISSMYEIALITENVSLLEYIKKEIKGIHNVKKKHRIVYSLSIAIIFNWFIMLLYDKKTILDFIICLYKNKGGLFIKICLTLLLIPIIITILFGIKHSVKFDNERIYFPDSKYKILLKEKEFLQKKSEETPT